MSAEEALAELNEIAIQTGLIRQLTETLLDVSGDRKKVEALALVTGDMQAAISGRLDGLIEFAHKITQEGGGR